MSDDFNDDFAEDTPKGNANTTFRRGVVRPMQCLSEGWQLIKEQYWLYFGITLVAVIIAGSVPLVLVGPMMCGVHYCLIRSERGLQVKFDGLFKGFQDFLPSFVATLLMTLPMIVILVPAYIVMIVFIFAAVPQPGQAPNPNAGTNFFIMLGLFYLLVILVSIVMSVLCFFIYPLVTDRKLSGVQAVKTSMAAAFGNLGGILGLVLLQMLLSLLGALACYVGMLFVLPLHFASVAVAYRKVFPEIDSRYLGERYRDDNVADYED